MRTLLRNDFKSGFNTDFRCSECGWTFSRGHKSAVLDYLDEREGERNFDAHRCSDFLAQSGKKRAS